MNDLLLLNYQKVKVLVLIICVGCKLEKDESFSSPNWRDILKLARTYFERNCVSSFVPPARSAGREKNH